MPAGSICLVGMGWEDGLPEAITRTESSGGYPPGHLGWNSFTERSKKLKLGCLFLFISRLTLPENYLGFLLHFTCPANLQRSQLIAWFLVVQSLSCVWLSVTPRTATGQAHLSPRVCSNSCSLRRWCYPTISSSIVPFSSCPQSFPAPGSFPRFKSQV